MIQVCIFFPLIMENTFENTYKSIRQASIELGLSYYFLYNCFHCKHRNQFRKFIKVETYRGETINNNDHDDCFEYPEYLWK